MKQKNDKIIPFRHPGRQKKRMVVFLASLSVLILLVSFFAIDNGKNWDSIGRYFTYGGRKLEIPLTGKAEQTTQMDGELVVADTQRIIKYDQEGKEAFVASMSMNVPVLDTTKERLLAYDAGGKTLLLLDGAGNSLISSQPTGRVLHADLASDGAVCYTATSSRYKSQLQVYDRNQLLCYTVYSVKQYFTACAVAPGADNVCAIALGTQDGGFASSAMIYETDREEPVAQVPLGNQLIYDVTFWGKDTICALGETSLVVFTTDGEVLGTYPCDKVVAFDLEGNSFAALVYEAEGGYELATVDKQGRELGRVSMESFYGLDVAGKYVARLDETGLVISGKGLETWFESQDGLNATGVQACDNGTAFLTDSQRARLFLP